MTSDHIKVILNNIGVIYNRKKLLNDIIKELQNKEVTQQNIYDEIIIFLKNKNIYNYNKYSWLFFGKEEFDKEETKPFIEYPIYNTVIKNNEDISHLWKIFINPKLEYFAKVFKIIILTCLNNNINFYGKISKPIEENPKRGLKDCPNPRFLFYFYSISSLKHFIQIIHNEFSKQNIEKWVCDIIQNRIFNINSIKFDVPAYGPSFTKSYNKLIYYGQSGYSESTRQIIVQNSNIVANEMTNLKTNKNIDNQDRRALKIQKYILNLQYDGENFFKFKGYLDPLEKNDITNKRNTLKQNVENIQSIKDKFHSLMFTHNTTILRFLEIINSTDQHLRPSLYRGVQFRYGLDSQYGEIKMIFKKNNYLLKKVLDRTNNNDILINGVFHYVTYDNLIYRDFWNEINLEKDELNKRLNNEALNYNFRLLDKDIKGYARHPSDECYYKYKTKSTWCNIQTHSSSNISLRHVEAILVPSFVYSDEFQKIIKNDKNFNKILGDKTIKEYLNNKNNNFIIDHDNNKRINYVHNKILIINNELKDYYGFINKSRINNNSYDHEYLLNICNKYTIPFNYDKDNDDIKYSFRNNFLSGNSSLIGTKLHAFTKEEQMYVKILLYNNCFMEKSKYDVEKIKLKLINIEQKEYLSESDSDSEAHGY